MEKVTVLGAGSWGTALGAVLAENGHDCLIWTRRKEQSEEINNQHTNQQYLPGTKLPSNLHSTHSLSDAAEHSSIIVVGVPSKAIREVCRELNGLLTKPVMLVHISKGIEPDSLKRISEMIREGIAEELIRDLVVLSGPSHAEEVVLKHPTTVTAACENLESAEFVQDLFMNQYLRVYTNNDVIGVELGGALKNVIGLAAGIVDGLGYGDNAKAALITRGLAEISRLGVKMGAQPLTFSGLTGLGDLIATCTSVHSRNWRAGNLLGKGHQLEEVLEMVGMVVEGVRTTKAAYQLSQEYDVPMPITQALYKVLFEGRHPKEAVDKLMLRMKKQEMEELFF